MTSLLAAMLGPLRRVGSLLMQVWLCLLGTLRRLLWGQKKGTQTPPLPAQNWNGKGEGDGEWESWDSVEPFTVKVVPSDPQAASGSTAEPHPPNGPLTSSTQPNQSDDAEADLFRELQPVIKKTKKLYVRPSHHQESGNSQKFAVDSVFQPEQGTSELGVWSEEGPSWEEGLELDQGELVKQSEMAIREKRREERERRKQQQELLRIQKAQAATHSGLGTRLPSS